MLVCRSPRTVLSRRGSVAFLNTPLIIMQTTRILALLFALVGFISSYSAQAATLITTNVQAAGANWTAAIWKTLITDTTFVAPVAGNNYVAIPNGILQSGNVNSTRLRNPATDGTQTFPGDSLTVQTNGEIRFKKGATAGVTFPFVTPTISSFPGVGGNPGLILDGAVLDPGDDATFPIAGSVRVAGDTILGLCDGGINSATPTPLRGLQFTAALSGTGSLIVVGGVTNFANAEVTSVNNSYTGSWIVKAGWLKGTGSNSLGKGNITLNPTYSVSSTLITAGANTALSNGPVRFELNYNIDTPGTLTVSGDSQIVLHQDLRFAKVFVDGNPIPNGTYTYADIVTAFPTHIVGGGSGSISIGPATPSGLAAIPGDGQARLTWTGSQGATGYVIYRGLSSGLSTNGTPVFTNGTSTAYTDTGLANGTPYYYVVSAISAGGESTNSAEIVVTPAAVVPVIAVDVVGATNCTGTSVSFSVVSTNTFPVTYQWYYNSTTALPNQTNSTYTTNNIQLFNAGTYSVIVSNNSGSVTSSLATLAVKQATVAVGPVNQTNCPGSPVTFTTTASGAGTLTYTWRKGSTVLTGPNGNNFYSIGSIAPGDAGQYSVTVIGDCNTISNSFLFVVAPAPIITAQPRDITVPMGNGTVFSVTALTTNAGAAPLSYQWRTNGVDVTGAMASTFAISNLTLVQNGTLVSVAVTDCAGTTLSSAATLTVRPIFGLSYDFNTPGQFTNAPFNLLAPGGIDWMAFGAAANGAGANPATSMTAPAAGGAQVQIFEVSTGGVGVAVGGGALDFTHNVGGDLGMLLFPASYDFSSSGKVLNASVTFKMKNANGANLRGIQWGFTTTTNYNNQYQGINANDQCGWMTVIMQSPGVGNLMTNYGLRAQHKLISGTTAFEYTNMVITVSNQVNTTPGSLASTGTNGWYKLTAAFMNIKGSGTNGSNYTISASMQSMGPDGQTPGTMILAFSDLIVTNIDMVNQTNLFFVMRFSGGDQSGLDYLDNIYVTTAPGPIAFVSPLSNVSVSEGGNATFKAMVDGDGPYTYQWYKNGTAIPGAGNWKYTTPSLLLSDSGSQYTVSVTSTNNSITNNTATLTVTASPLQLVSVGSVDGGVIGVRFGGKVNPANATVGANYLVNGLPAVGAQVRPNGSDVLIVPPATISGAFTVSVYGVTTPSGTALGASTNAVGAVEGLVGYDVDANASGFFAAEMALNANGAVATYPGESFSFAPGNFELIAGGHDIFTGFDGMRFVYKQITGDFDIKMRVINQDAFRFSQKCGLHARISLDAFSPMAGVYYDAPYPQLNKTEGTGRIFWGGGGISWGTNTGAFYPNAWLRLRRSGQTFLRYSSTNGVNWLCDGQFSPQLGAQAWPNTLYVGIGANCNVGGGAVQFGVRSQMDGFGNFAGYTNPVPVITITTQPAANPSVAAGASATLTVVASASNIPQNGLGGELSYLWQKTNSAVAGGWTNLPNAGVTNAVFTTAALFGGDQNTHFRVIVTAPGATPVTSTASRITITDVVAPTIATTGVVAPTNATDKVYITFSEFVSAATALNKANYLITNGAGQVFGIASISFNWTAGDQRAVIITTSNALPSDWYGVVVSGVQDLFGVPIATVTRTFKQWSSYPFAGPIQMDVYQGLASTGLLLDLTNNARYLINSPDYITYSNVFGWNHQVNGAQTGPADNFGVKMFAYFTPTNTTNYTFWWKADDYAVFSMNTNAVGSTNPAGRVFGNTLTVNQGSYFQSNSFATPLLNAGQQYYIEYVFKEGGGGDYGAVACTIGTTNTGASATPPAATLALGADLLTPAIDLWTPVKVMVEQYTNLLYSGQSLFPAQVVAANGNKSDMVLATNTAKYIAGIPDMFGYTKHSGMYTNLAQSGGDNYLGKFYTYFIPPSSGNYRFWIRSDDSCQLFMNTNSANSTDPAGKNFLGELFAYPGNATTYYPATNGGQNVSLVGGQRYYLEGLWREGTGGDGMSVTVRSAADATTPPFTEVIPFSMLEFPTNLNRVGPVNFNGSGSKGGIAPVSPTVTEGRQVTFFAQGVAGSAPYFFLWLRNGAIVEAAPAINSANNVAVAPFYRTPPVTLADNGAVYSLVVSNLFSVVTQSTTLTVTADVTPPTIVSAVGSQFDTTVLLTFSESLDPYTAGQVANYRLSGGVTVLSATYDPVAKNQVALRTTLQTAGAQYTVTVNGVRDFVGNAIAANSMITFSAWGFGGLGTVYVEYWTNLLGGSYAALENDPRYLNNQPSGAYYTNNFTAGQNNGVNGGDSGRSFWGARVTGMFMPPSNGLYRFFVRGDDGSKLFMNTNGPNPNGAVMIAQSLGANSSTYYNGQSANGAANIAASFSAPISLTNGVGYFMQAIFKEGTGGDFLSVVFRGVDAATLTDYPPLGAPTGAGDTISGGLFSTTGNPDINQFLIGSQPPAELTVYQNDPVFLELVANTIPVSLAPFINYQWQKTNTANGTFTNIPGATTRSLSFFAPLTDDGLTYRLLASIPGKTLVLPTLLHVLADTTQPYIVSVSSLDGTTIGVHYDGPVDLGIALEPSTYYFDVPFDGAVVTTATLKPGDPTRVLLTLDPLSTPYPIYGDFTLYASYVKDLAGNESFDVFATGAVQRLTAKDIYLTSGNVAGGYNLALPGSTWTDTNGGFDISANGYDIWNTADGFHFAYREVTGNFDIKTRINKLVGADQWSKAGLMARASTNANSRMMFMCAVPTTTPIAGQAANNFFAAQYRDVDGGAPGNVQNTVPPSYPNAAVRLQRSNSVFYGFWSTNGTDGPWTLLFSRDTAPLGVFPDTLQVGLATTSHDQTRALANNAYAEYRDFYFPAGAVITAQPQPTEATITIGINQSVTFSNLVATGSLQWRRNGLAVPNATNATFTIADTSVSDSGTYTVSASTDGGGQISSNIYLIVTNQLLVVTNDSITATQNVAYTFPGSLLTGNDFDPEGDPLSILAVYSPHTIATNFDAGNLSGTIYSGTAHWTNGVGAVSSGALVLNDSIAGAVGVSGSAVINEITTGSRVLAFTANFGLRVANPTAEPADGFSFNFANDLPTGNSSPTNANTGAFAAENGVTATGFSFCLDNYRFAPYPAGGNATTSGLKIRYNNVDIAGVQIPAAWNNNAFIPVSITITREGLLTVLVDGTNVFGNRLIAWTPSAGRFGFYGRTGGQSESHWIDDLNINLLAEDTARGGLVSLSGTDVTYTPPAGACGTDSFNYLVSDGQVGGTNVGLVTVNIIDTNGPSITTCVANQNLVAGASCTALLPDLRSQLVVANCGNVTVTQSPAPGSALPLGPNIVTFSATNTSGLGTNCQATITVVDTTAPVAICPGNITAEATSLSGAAVSFSISGTDNCTVSSVVANPASGSTFSIGVTTVTVTATDGAGNTNACTFTVTVQDTTAPGISCPANQVIACTATNGAIATYSAGATDAVDPSPTVIVTPPSGSLFPVGTNAVLVTAYDFFGNTNTCTFNVVVQDQTPAILTIWMPWETNAIVCWPQSCTTYTLESTTNLAPPIAWSPVGLPVDVAGTNYCVTVPIAGPGTNMFFRLYKP
jgi:hypothetical protein